jgi:cyclohexanecarboxylate-CoA ligase
MGDALQEARTIWELVERRSALSPDAPMLIGAMGERVSFGEFRERAERRAAGLHGLGVRDSTPVTWQLPSTIETIVLTAALARLGALQNPILHIYREREVAVALRGTGSELFVVPGVFRGVDFAAMAASVAGRLERPPRILLLGELPEGDPAVLPPAPAAPAVPAAPSGEPREPGDPVRWIYYTSGTTSEPKGVRHTDGTLLAGGRGLVNALQLTPGDVGSIAFPFAHIAGPDYLVTMLMSGFSALVLEAFIPAEAVAAFRRFGVTLAGGSTAFYQAILHEQRKQPDESLVPTLRMLAGGGAPKPPEIFHEARRELGVTIRHGYGMTEVPMITQGSIRDDDEQLIFTEGAPVDGADLRVVLADGQLALEGEDGEVRVKGPMVCKGYTDAVLTAEAFDEDGYFRTGDIGHLRSDGHLVLTGRLKDVIIRKGENISAKEVEALLYAHPRIADVAVIGLPDPARGERVCAVVETAPGETPVDLEEVEAYLRDSGLMTQKIPEQLEVVERLPRNEALQKVLKYKLREEYGAKPWPS